MRAIETSLEEDLSLFSRYLRQQRVPHRIFEERGRQVVEVPDAAAVDGVRAAYQAWRGGRLVLKAHRNEPLLEGPGALDRFRVIAGRFPVLIVLIALAVVAFPFSVPVGDGKLTAVASWLTIVDLQGGRSGLEALLGGELWRWITPIFLHFSVVHLLFNVAVTADLGRRVELGRGSLGFAGIVLAIGLVSNVGQYLMTGNPLFGGLSGVAYGLLGYVLVASRRFPDAAVWQVHPGFAFSLVLFLVIFSTGITEPFGLYVANGAHWFGFVSGGLLAFLPARRREAS
ncbi:MAG: rhomboid family intramembrane serine protease [Pseudomonadales bacterium]